MRWWKGRKGGRTSPDAATTARDDTRPPGLSRFSILNPRYSIPIISLVVLLPILVFLVSWFTIDWSPEGSDSYPGGIVLRDSSGGVIRVSLGPGDSDCRPYYSASPDDWIVKALVAAEDGDFWRHCGVRPLSALRAAFQNIVWRRRISGASTITMQAVRLIKPHHKSLFEKWVESIRAMKMERERDKCWILSQYLNRAPFGSNFIGVEAAAQGWFGKGAKDLGPGEAALLAGMVQAPSRFRPDRWPERALKRREYVLARMVKTGCLSEAQAQWARTVKPVLNRAPRPFLHPHYCDWALRAVGRDPRNPGGGDIVTALDPDIQSIAAEVVSAISQTPSAPSSSARPNSQFSTLNSQSSRPASAAVVMRVSDGAIIALACSGDYFSRERGQVNTAVAPRPAGSTLKPFLSALAMDRGLVTPEERLSDVPMAFKGYRPANFDARHRGAVTLRDSLVLSLNLPFVRLLQKTGVPRFGACLRSLGFSHMNAPDFSFGLGMAIGNVEVTLLELVAAYGALARAGQYIPPSPLGELRMENGELRIASSALPSTSNSKPQTSDSSNNSQFSILNSQFSPASAYLVSDMLSGDERRSHSLGHVADVVMPRFAWKTGTSAGCRDAWTIVWNPVYVIGVWCGDPAGGTAGGEVVGARDAAPHAWRIARALYPRNDGPWFVEPAGVIRRTICSKTGLPANPDCPQTEEGRAVKGRSSPALCPVHSRDANGKVVEREDPALAAFRGGAASKLVIAAPEEGAVFTLAPGPLKQRVVCKVHGNSQNGRLWWFLDGVPQGETAGAAPFVCDPAPGEHEVLCASAEGLSASVRFKIVAQ